MGPAYPPPPCKDPKPNEIGDTVLIFQMGKPSRRLQRSPSSPNSRLLYYSLRSVKVTATASVSCRFSFVEECLLSAPCLPAVKACGHTGIRGSRQHFCPQRHWSPPQTALFCICDTWCPARSHKKQQGREQLICKVVTTQGHWLVPFPGRVYFSPQSSASCPSPTEDNEITKPALLFISEE